MAPVTDETVDGLKNIIGNLEARVAELEQRLVNGGSSSKPPSMRMILMGPPGAGMNLDALHFSIAPPLTVVISI